jgi:hypothetical protein
MFPDSTAAKRGKKTAGSAGGEDGDGPVSNEEATAQQIAFAYLMRGVHW